MQRAKMEHSIRNNTPFNVAVLISQYMLLLEHIIEYVGEHGPLLNI